MALPQWRHEDGPVNAGSVHLAQQALNIQRLLVVDVAGLEQGLIDRRASPQRVVRLPDVDLAVDDDHGLNPVQGFGVVADDLALDFGREVGRLALDDVTRARPGAVRMRIVGGPHDVPVAEEVDQVEADEVLLVGRPNLAAEEFAGQRLQRHAVRAEALARLLEAVVHLLDDIWDPADAGLAQTDLKVGMALEHAVAEEAHEGLVEARGAVAQTHAEGRPAPARLR